MADDILNLLRSIDGATAPSTAAPPQSRQPPAGDNPYYDIFSGRGAQSAPPEPHNPGLWHNLTHGVGRGIDSIQMSLDYFAGAVFEELGWNDWAEASYANAAEELAQIEANPAEVPSYKDIDGAGAAITYIVEGIGEMLPSFLATAGAGGAAVAGVKAAVASQAKRLIQQRSAALIAQGLPKEAALQQAAREITAQVSKRLAAGAFTGGAYAGSATLSTGAIAAGQHLAAGETDLGSALGLGLVAGSLDVLPQFRLFNRYLGSVAGEAAGNLAAQNVKKSLVRRLGEEGAKNFFLEGSTEALQTLIENIGVLAVDPNAELWSEENIDDMIDAFLKGGASGGVIGMGLEAAFGGRSAEKPNTETSPPPVGPEAPGTPRDPNIPGQQGGPLPGEPTLGQQLGELQRPGRGKNLVGVPVNKRRFGVGRVGFEFNNPDEMNLFRLGQALSEKQTPNPAILQAAEAAYGPDRLQDKARRFYEASLAQLKGKSPDELRTAQQPVNFDREVARFIRYPEPVDPTTPAFEAVPKKDQMDERLWHEIHKRGLVPEIEDKLADGKSIKEIIKELSAEKKLGWLTRAAKTLNRQPQGVAERLVTVARKKLGVPLPKAPEFKQWLADYEKYSGRKPAPLPEKPAEEKPTAPAPEDSTLAPPQDKPKKQRKAKQPQPAENASEALNTPWSDFLFGKRQQELGPSAPQPAPPTQTADTTDPSDVPLRLYRLKSPLEAEQLFTTSPVLGMDQVTGFIDVPAKFAETYRLGPGGDPASLGRLLDNHNYFVIPDSIWSQADFDRLVNSSKLTSVKVYPHSSFTLDVLDSFTSVFGNTTMAASDWVRFFNDAKDLLHSPKELDYYGLNDAAYLTEILGENIQASKLRQYLALHQYGTSTSVEFKPVDLAGGNLDGPIGAMDITFSLPIGGKMLPVFRAKGDVKLLPQPTFHVTDVQEVQENSQFLSQKLGAHIFARSLARHLASSGFSKIEGSVPNLMQLLAPPLNRLEGVKVTKKAASFNEQAAGNLLHAQANYGAYLAKSQAYNQISPITKAFLTERLSKLNRNLGPVVFRDIEDRATGGYQLGDTILMNVYSLLTATPDPATAVRELITLGVHEGVHGAAAKLLFTPGELNLLFSAPYQDRLLYLIRRAAEDGSLRFKTFLSNTKLFESALGIDRDDHGFMPRNQHGHWAEEVVAYGTEAMLWYLDNNRVPPIGFNTLIAEKARDIRQLADDIQEQLGHLVKEGDDLLLAYLNGRMADRLPANPEGKRKFFREALDAAEISGFKDSVKQYEQWIAGSMLREGDGTPTVMFRTMPINAKAMATPDDIGWHFGSIDHAGRRWSELPGSERNAYTVWPVVSNINSAAYIHREDLDHPDTLLDALTIGKGKKGNTKLFGSEEHQTLSKKMEGKPRDKAFEILREALKAKKIDALSYEDGGASAYVALDPGAVRNTKIPDETTPHKTDGEVLAQGLSSVAAWKEKAKKINDVTGHLKNYGLFDRFINTAKHVAHRFPAFTKIFMAGVDRARYRTLVASEAIADTATGKQRLGALRHLPAKSREQIYKALELARRLGLHRIPQDEDGNYTITNPGGLDGTFSAPNETITLTPQEASALEAMTEGFNYILKDIRDSLMLQSGFSPDLSADDLHTMISELEDSKFALSPEEQAKADTLIQNLENLIERVIDPLDSMMGSHYVPFVRFGDRGLTVHRLVEDDQGRVRQELVWFQTFETKGVNRFSWRKQVVHALEELKEKFAGPDYIISKPFDLNHDRIKREMADSVWILDTLSSLLNNSSQEAYAKIRDELVSELRTRGFPVHWAKAKMVPGYNHDLMGSVGKYVAAASTYAADLRYYGRLKEGLNAIDRSSNEALYQYADNYINYIMSPSEEFAAWRNLGFLTFLGFNPSSAVLQAATLPLFTAPYLGQAMGYGSAMKNLGKNFTKMIYVALRSIKNRGAGQNIPFNVALLKGYDEPIRQGLTWLWDHGYLSPALTLEQAGLESTQRRFLGGKLGTGWTRLMEASSLMFNTAEIVSRASAAATVLEQAARGPEFMTRFNEAHAKDALWQSKVAAGRGTPVDAAIHVIEQTFGVYGKETRPAYMRGAGAAIFQFQTYPQQMIELWARMMKDQGPAGKRAFAITTLTLLMVGGLQGLPGAENLKDMFEFVWRNVTGEDLNLDAEIRTLAEAATGDRMLGEMITSGALNAILGMDAGRRMALGNLPALNNITALFNPNSSNLEMLGVPGSILGNSGTFFETLQAKGLGRAVAETYMPTAAKNLYQAFIQWPEFGITRANGDLILSPESLENRDFLLKALGFNSAKIGEARRGFSAATRAAQAVSDLQSRFYTELSDAYVALRRANAAGDRQSANEARQKVEDVRRRVAAHNKTAPLHQRIQFDNDYLQRLIARKTVGMQSVIRDSTKKARKEMQRLDHLYNWRVQDDN